LRSFPKHLNTKQDYLNCEQLVAEGKLPKQKLIEAYEALKNIQQHYVHDKMLTTEPTKVDADAKVMPVYDEKQEVEEYTQFKLVDNPDSKLLRMGFETEDVDSKITTLKEKKRKNTVAAPSEDVDSKITTLKGVVK
jgi:hypothetical protein